MHAWGMLVLVGCLVGVAAYSVDVAAQNARSNRQEILGPGLYLYQTRVTEASCNDATPTGYVESYVAAINGVPGNRTMDMMLTNSEHWKEWSVTIHANGLIVAEARVRNRNARFEVRRNGSRFTGTGYREYRSNGSPCRIEFDALLRRVDVQARR